MFSRPLITASTVIALACVVTVASTSARQAAPADAWTALTATLDTAALADNAAGVKDARVAVLRLLAASPSGDQAPLYRYTIAYADWRLAFSPQATKQEQADFVKDGEVQLDAAIARRPKFADALALEAGIYGAQIAKNPELGMSVGPLADEVLGKALALEPNNPRALVLKGEDQAHTPPEYGGSTKDAEASFRKALAAFGSEPQTKAWPNWGRFDAHVWLGQMLAGRGDKTSARAEYEAALVMAPNSGWVRYTLLPAVK